MPFVRPNGFDFKLGYYISFPIAYSKSMRVTLKWNGSSELDDEQLWNISKICKRNNAPCPVKAYYAAIANKLVYGSKLSTTFADYFPKDSIEPRTKHLNRVTKTVSEMIRSPEVYGAGMRSGCKLTCREVSPGLDVLIFRARNVAKVIQSLFFRVYDIKNGKPVMSKNWKKILITMIWDDKNPQVKEIPLFGIFNVGLDYLREVQSATAGFKNTTCSVEGNNQYDIPPRDWLAFLLYEMPFWQSAEITVKIPKGYGSALVCSGVATKDLTMDKYHPSLTGYFSAQLNQQGFDLGHHKTVFHVTNQWGHIVAINYFMRKKGGGSGRTQELDLIIETEGSDVPMYSGSGVEDFFHYIHDFVIFRNKTSVFNGIPYYFRIASKTKLMLCYRHMLLDPILFTTGIRVYLESHWDRSRRSGTLPKFLPVSTSFSQTIPPDSLTTIVLFYGSKGSGGTITDRIIYAEMNNTASRKFHVAPSDVYSFPVRSMFENTPGKIYNKMVVSMIPGQQVTHTFIISQNNIGVVIRREYRTVVPNQKAKVKVDGEDAGLWFCPQRAFTDAFSLRIHDYLLPPESTVGKDRIKVTLIAVTQWESISLTVLSVLLTH